MQARLEGSGKDERVIVRGPKGDTFSIGREGVHAMGREERGLKKSGVEPNASWTWLIKKVSAFFSFILGNRPPSS